MDPSLKKLNPQNYAYFGLLVRACFFQLRPRGGWFIFECWQAQSNPDFFAPDCFIGGQLGSSRRALSCPDIANGIPGDVDLDDFEDDDDFA
jgi:hypothetical protein